jgi:drug/metabolite transporter (DMT)-like permease
MNENDFSRRGVHGCSISIVITLLVIGAMAISTNYEYSAHPSCRGALGAGFPALFICDAGLGGSPIDSWGKIDLADVFNRGIRPEGFIVDFFFYLALIWSIGLVVNRLLHNRINPRDVRWATFISIGFIFGFLCAFLVFQSSSAYDPHIPTPTPPGITTPVIATSIP